MKGVILAGGKGTRLAPMTSIMNKHLLPIGKYPMIHYGIERLAEAGVKDILLLISKQSAGLYCDYVGSGDQFGVRITFRVQEDADGIAGALGLAEGFVQPQDKFVLLLGDNLFDDSLGAYLAAFARQEKGAKVLLKQVDDPRRFGVPELEGDKIKLIEEKPSKPKSSYCVTGIYMYDGTVFEKIRSIRPSRRGELEITDVNNLYAAEGSLTYEILQGWWTDAGTFASLLDASNYLQGKERNGR
ncbi:sugar phosphate nucleotidyltransferase [Paenibacillus chartarius]|uniref:Glucose-1-phosphate thymidylyltransferase n=1 Tax=Paenibacillus chartarius TaxID=747481 RepID=A0ABV6DII7_9BACL